MKCLQMLLICALPCCIQLTADVASAQPQPQSAPQMMLQGSKYQPGPVTDQQMAQITQAEVLIVNAVLTSEYFAAELQGQQDIPPVSMANFPIEQRAMMWILCKMVTANLGEYPQATAAAQAMLVKVVPQAVETIGEISPNYIGTVVYDYQLVTGDVEYPVVKVPASPAQKPNAQN